MLRCFDLRPLIVALLLFAFTGAGNTSVRAETVRVYAAASLGTVLADISQGFEAQHGHRVVLVLAGSSRLARQIEHGAPADVFISANSAWMDHLIRRKKIAGNSRFDLAGNRLALIARGAADGGLAEITPEFDLVARLNGRRLAMAQTDAVPAGIYGKAALRHLGLWKATRSQLAETDSVRGALALVATGAAPYGVVYATDVGAERRVHAVGLFPRDSHPPIRYPVALVGGPRPEAARQFLDFLRGQAAQKALEKHGFLPVLARPEE